MKDLSIVVTQAHACNSLLEKLNQLAATKGFMIPAGKAWLDQFVQPAFSLGRYCQSTEEALAAVYGQVRP